MGILTRRAQQGDGAAWQELVRVHEPALFGFTLRRVGRADVAEDVTQDVLVALLQEPPVSDAALPGRLRWVAQRRIEALA